MTERLAGIHRRQFLHIAIDDHSRLAFTAMYPDQTEASASSFLTQATAWLRHSNRFAPEIR
jgi:hypothetical protein